MERVLTIAYDRRRDTPMMDITKSYLSIDHNIRQTEV